MNFRNVTISLALMALGTLSASAATNIALNKPTDASSGTSALAVDGNTGTRGNHRHTTINGFMSIWKHLMTSTM